MVVVVDVISGDITKEPSDALITGINTGTEWYGGIDDAIKSVASDMFHGQVRAVLPLKDGQIVLAAATQGHGGGFQNVIFIADGQQRPLGELLTFALREADNRNMRKVTIPAMRTGRAAGLYERTVEDVVGQLCSAIHGFIATGPRHVQHIRFVIYGDPAIEDFLSWRLGKAA